VLSYLFVEGQAIEATVFYPNMELDVIEEDPEEESQLTFDGPGEYMDPKEPIEPEETTPMAI